MVKSTKSQSQIFNQIKQQLTTFLKKKLCKKLIQ